MPVMVIEFMDNIIIIRWFAARRQSVPDDT